MEMKIGHPDNETVNVRNSNLTLAKHYMSKVHKASWQQKLSDTSKKLQGVVRSGLQNLTENWSLTEIMLVLSGPVLTFLQLIGLDHHMTLLAAAI